MAVIAYIYLLAAILGQTSAVTKIVFHRLNINDGLLVTYTLLVVSIFSFSLTYDKINLLPLLAGHLLIVLLPLVLATYKVVTNGHSVTVTKLFIGLPYQSVTHLFDKIHFSRERIIFNNALSKLEIIDYTGDGYWLGDFPDCILVTLADISLVLGRKKDFPSLHNKLSILKQNAS